MTLCPVAIALGCRKCPVFYARYGVYGADVDSVHSQHDHGSGALACVIYFWTRIVHYLAYTFRIPWVRTLSFAVGFGCQITLACKILA